MSALQEMGLFLLVLFLLIVCVGGIIALFSIKSERVKARLRREEQEAAQAAARKMEAERAEAQKPYNEKALAWVKARQAEGEPKMTYGEYGRLWGFPIDTQEEYDAFRQSAYANAIEVQPSRRGGAYEMMQELQSALANVQYPYVGYSLSHGNPFLRYTRACYNCNHIFRSASAYATECPRCGRLV